MRLPEAKIKEAVVHPEKLAREEALRYFADCYSRDAEVMPRAIQAIETFGRSQAFTTVGVLERLAQTEATVEWAIAELHREEDRAEDHEIYFPALSHLLCGAEPQIIAPRADQILRAPGFLEDLAPELREHLELASWDADQCWTELERICAAALAGPDSSDVDFYHASRVVEALARRCEKDVDRILALLGQTVEDFETDPMSWLEIFLVELAGEMRLERAIPLVVKKLHAGGEILSEECVEALGKIGTDAAAEAVTEGWLASDWDYRIYASGALGAIHSDTTVRKCLELLPQDKDVDIRTNLADALLGQFADEGIEPVREMVERRAYDPMVSDLMGRLVAVSTVLGVEFPEYPIWKGEAAERLAKQERRMKEMRRFFEAAAEPRSPPEPAREEEPGDFLERKRAPFLRTEKPVGRNDPCPCGSGKKFKKCCMNRGKG